MRNIKEITAEELFHRLKNIKATAHACRFSIKKCEELTPIINRINYFKRKKNTVILAHSYVAPEIVYGVADYVGDSYKLSQDALNCSEENILFAAVKFMGETAKIINPHKRVFLPSEINGCTLADAIDEDQVIELRKQYPEYTFICYINTTAAVKAHCDVCVTSSNVYNIVENYPSNKIYFLPDRLMGENIIVEMKRRKVNKQIQIFDGNCYVHKSYDPEVIDFIRMEYPSVAVAVHPECSSEVVSKSDFVGSTEQILKYVYGSSKNDFFILTECGLIDRLKKEVKEKNFVGSCTLCRYMKSNTLEGIEEALINPRPELEIKLSSKIIDKARHSIENMFRYTQKTAVPKVLNIHSVDC